MKTGGIGWVLLPLLFVVCAAAGAADSVFPGKEWERRSPGELGVNGGLLDRLESQLGGRGCVVKDGYVIKTWGNQTNRGDWFSSAKPVLSTLLFFALQEGLVESVDQPIAAFGWPLKPKDRGITFRHLGSMSSGYARPEAAGEAWSYNDYAIQLYQKTLFDRVFKGDPKLAAEDPKRLGGLGLQDGFEFNEKRRLYASVRDFARIAWFWLNKGQWADTQLLPRAYFDAYMKPQTPKDLPQTKTDGRDDDYLGIGSYGGTSDHFSDDGPGTYGFNWWFNDTGRTHPNVLSWPDAPRDAVMSIGARGNNSVIVPGLNLVMVCADGDWDGSKPADPQSKINRALKLLVQACDPNAPQARIAGTLAKWQTVTLSFDGPTLAEAATPNPFTDYRLQVSFTRGGRAFAVPGYYAADGSAAETGADAGGVWRVHFVPDEEGKWNYLAEFQTAPGLATEEAKKQGDPLAFDGTAGSFEVGPVPADAPGFLGKGMLRTMGRRYPQFAETGEYFIKGGCDSPENLLAFADFDGTPATHRLEPHRADWRPGDPVWRGDKGKGLIGALDYLESKGVNSVYFITMTVEGDGKDVWPWTGDSERFRFDCSKLDQWEIVFSHMDRLGIALHLVGQEQENDQLLDKGKLGPERKLYYRELIARFGHHLALTWNLGEENTNTDAQRKSFAGYISATDPYRHPIACHTFPNQYDKVYRPLLGFPYFDGVSLQMGDMTKTHEETLEWVKDSWRTGRQWFAWLDEIGPPNVGVKPDAEDPNHDDVRRYALWGNLMAGGAGCEWFFQNDIKCEDLRSRDAMWDQTRHALQFFNRYLPFADMEPHDELASGEAVWCLAKPGEIYAVYAPVPANGVSLELPNGKFTVQWYDPRTGGPLQRGKNISGGGVRSLGEPPGGADHDWVALVSRRK